MNSGDLSEPIKYCLWLENIPFKIPLSLLSADPRSYGVSDKIKIQNLPDEFLIFVVKKTDSVIIAGVYRKRVKTDEKPDDGYALRFYFSMTGFDEETQSAILRHGDASATTTFLLNDNVRDRINKSHVLFDLFVTVQMLKFRSLDKSDPRKMISNACTNFLKRKLTKKEVVLLGGVLKIPNLEDVFTGRQNSAFSNAKSIYIRNTALYAKEIADYLRAKEACVSVPVTDLGLIVNFILHGKREPVTNEILFEGYILGHLLGMYFLVELTRDLIIMRFPKNVTWVNHGLLIIVLRIADSLHDEILFEKAAEIFQKWERELENPEALFDLLKCRGIKSQFMLYSLTRRCRKIAEAGRHAIEIGEPSQQSSSPLQYITLILNNLEYITLN